jgi:uracil-DNA glycosylase family 4
MFSRDGAELTVSYDRDCVRCPRLADFLGKVRHRYPQYACRPVPPFGDDRARLLIVGLAPGMHGANRSGRPFTGDHAGILLYETLRDFGFANQAGSPDADDGLVLDDCRITNAVKCLPPENKPLPAEIRTCNGYLTREIDALRPRVVLALGLVAHRAVLMARGLAQGTCTFAHGARHVLPDGLVLIDSYHCSRYNTQTRRLTPAMFQAVFRDIRDVLDGR